MPPAPTKLTPAALQALVASAKHLAADSRQVQPGSVFFALQGEKVDGRAFITDALARGASAVVVEGGEAATGFSESVPVYISDNGRRDLALAAAAFYRQRPAQIVAVTGTNGKTSTVDIVRQLLQALGYCAASIGTLGVRSPVLTVEGSLTTPDALRLYALLAQLAGAGVSHVALEASSHGLHQHRLDGLPLQAAAFTNLTRDHLDYHKTKAAYFEAKMQLFERLLPSGALAVAWQGSPYYEPWQQRCNARGHRLLGYGTGAADGLHLLAQELTPKGQRLTLRHEGVTQTVVLPIAGTFQALNLLAALGLLLGMGIPLAESLAVVPMLAPVPGRLEAVTSAEHPFQVYVDYAHTPDALEQVLKALRPHTRGRLLVVFGCGGDRDKGKRPQMGVLAARLADVVIVTDDNPRSEDPVRIRQEIIAACPKAQNVGDRRLAIQAALNMARAGDVIVVAGKGHEQGQIIGSVVYPFADAAVVREALG